jgi:hypothetical protein
VLIDVRDAVTLFAPRSVYALQLKGVVQFIGGFIAGTAPDVSYRTLLSAVAAHGYVVIANRLPVVAYNHSELAGSLTNAFGTAYYDTLRSVYGEEVLELPVFGLGHSLGCKLLLLEECYSARPMHIRRAADALISFNNFDADHAKVFSDTFSSFLPQQGLFGALVKDVLDVFFVGLANEFTPSPAEFLLLVGRYYRVPRTLLVQFKDDTIDQSVELSSILRFGVRQDPQEQPRSPSLSFTTLDGTHVTPNLGVSSIDYRRLERTVLEFLDTNAARTSRVHDR